MSQHSFLRFFQIALMMGGLFSLPLIVTAQESKGLLGDYSYGVVGQLSHETYFGTFNQPGCGGNKECYDTAPEGYLFAIVHVHTGFYWLRVLVPIGAAATGDIIQVANPSKDTAGKYVKMGVRKSERNPSCDWVDGSEDKFTGGVSCQGWKYSEWTK